jgi:hypothetical protein
MADGESVKDASARLLATAALGGGVGLALYKGFRESPTSLQRVAEAVRGASGFDTPRLMVTTPIQEQSKLLSEGFSALEDVMDTGGREEILRRAYERALYGAGTVADDERDKFVRELVSSSKTWEGAEAAIRIHEQKLGGMEGFYSALREISGGTVRGSRRKDVAQLIREMSDIEPDEFGRRGGYLRSAFEPGGQFWKDRFGLQVSQSVDEIPMTSLGTSYINRATGPFATATGTEVDIGIRLSNRESKRLFQVGQQGKFEFTFGSEKLNLPYEEFRFGSKKRWFLQAPSAVQHRGFNFVAADHRGMAYASVPHFAVPEFDPSGKRVGYKKVSWNEGMQIALYGDEKRGIEGLAEKLHKLHGDEKAMRDLTWEWNTKVRGLFHRVTGSQGNMTQALMHSESILPLDRMMAQISGGKVDTSIEGLTDFYSQMKKSGFEVGPLAGADPMSQQYRVSLKDWSTRWDVFGEGYAVERKYAGRIKPFGMTTEAVEAMAQMPIGGVLPRGYGITQTALGRTEMHKMPQAVAYLSLGQAKHFGEEEAVISKRLAPMMKMKDIRRLEVLAGSTQANKGEILKQGAVIGVDYRTGETILAKGAKGMVEQKIIDARQVGNIVRLEVETQLPLQDQMKIFGYKAQVHMARKDITKELVHEWGAGKAALRFQKDLEFVGHADLMKKIPQEVNKQMAEASWLIMQKRLQEADVLRSGGKSKVLRQRLRGLAGKKTYSYKGGLPKDYVNMDMLMYVRDQKYRDQVLRNRQKSGVRLAKRLGLKGEQEALGVGLELMRYAKKHGLDQDEMSLIGGAFYKQLVKASGDSTAASSLLKEVGLTTGDIAALEKAEGVLAMPTMHVGGYASFDHKWRRAGMDYRALNEIRAQKWGEAGELLVGEIARRVVPANDLIQMERAAMSIVGRSHELPEGIERINRIRDAKEALGQKDFLFDYGGKEVYVPGPSAKGMRQFAIEPGEVASMELRGAYERYITAQQRLRDRPGEPAEAAAKEAFENLQRKVHKGWSAAGSLRGKVVGSAGPVARRWIPKDPTETLAREFKSIEEFVTAKDQVFTVGITKETGGKMFRDLLSKASPEERAFLEAQEKAFLAGEKVTGFVWRHPTHRPQSLMPAWMQLVEGAGESARFQPITIKHGERVLDISLAQGMKLDYDFDHVQVGVIANEKVKVAQDTLLNSRRWREEFIEGTAIQHDLMKRVKDAAASEAITDKTRQYIAGLQKLVGVKMETGIISDLVGEMRAATAFQTQGQEYKLISYMLAELEEGPISSKHGLHVGEIKGHLKTFVRGEGTGIRSAMTEAWDKLFGEATFTAGGIQYHRDKIIDQSAEAISAAEEAGHMAAFRNLARRGAKAQKGKEWTKITMDQFARAIESAQGGRGDLNSALAREMRMGPGSGISQSRAISNSLGEVASTAKRAFKKHWKYPAIGGAIAFGISSLLGGGDLSIPSSDHSQRVTELGQGPGVPHITPPSMTPNRIVTAGGGSMPVGYMMHTEADYSPQQIRQLGAYGHETGSSVRIKDDRGAITPEFIDKISRERYY